LKDLAISSYRYPRIDHLLNRALNSHARGTIQSVYEHENRNALNIFSPTQEFFLMYSEVFLLLLFLPNLVNTLYVLAHRSRNHRSVDQSITAINAGNYPLKETETLTMEQLRLEPLYLGLRTKKEFPSKTSRTSLAAISSPKKMKMLDELQEEGLISIPDGHLCPTPTGLAVAASLSLI
jgi:hypothetical protein